MGRGSPRRRIACDKSPDYAHQRGPDKRSDRRMHLHRQHPSGSCAVLSSCEYRPYLPAGARGVSESFADDRGVLRRSRGVPWIVRGRWIKSINRRRNLASYLRGYCISTAHVPPESDNDTLGKPTGAGHSAAQSAFFRGSTDLDSSLPESSRPPKSKSLLEKLGKLLGKKKSEYNVCCIILVSVSMCGVQTAVSRHCTVDLMSVGRKIVSFQRAWPVTIMGFIYFNESDPLVVRRRALRHP